MRQLSPKARDLEELARSLGRTIFNRGKEPTWVNKYFSELPPLSIPHHGGRDLATGTKHSILTQLEDDLAKWHEKIESNGKSH